MCNRCFAQSKKLSHFRESGMSLEETVSVVWNLKSVLENLKNRKYKNMELLRTVEFFPGNMFQFSVMVRTGIFISIKVVLKVTSLHIPDFLFIWATAALLKMLNALSFRVGTDFPVSSVPYFFTAKVCWILCCLPGTLD